MPNTRTTNAQQTNTFYILVFLLYYTMHEFLHVCRCAPGTVYLDCCISILKNLSKKFIFFFFSTALYSSNPILLLVAVLATKRGLLPHFKRPDQNSGRVDSERDSQAVLSTSTWRGVGKEHFPTQRFASKRFASILYLFKPNTPMATLLLHHYPRHRQTHHSNR